jgi:hypothetical protein
MTLTKAEKAVLIAANALVNSKGWAYFGTWRGEALAGIRKLERLEAAVAKYREAKRGRK